MKQVILCLAILAVGSSTKLPPGLRVTFGVGPGQGTEYFHNVPRTMGAARANKWTKVERPPSPMPSLTMFCTPGVYYLCNLFDPETHRLAGLQVALPMNEFTGAVFDWYIQGFIPWTPPTSNCSEPITYMTKQVYFTSEEALKKSKAERQKADSSGHVLQQNELWVLGYRQQLMRIPTNVAAIEKIGFTKQACFPRMGLHYFFKMTRETKCASDTMFNWFLLTDPQDNTLLGIAFNVVGFMPKKSGQKNYYETSTRALLEAIVPYSPECARELAGDPTITSMHMYFTDEPWNIKCSRS